MKQTTDQTVRNAIFRGDLAAIEIIGASGKVSAYAVHPSDAREWEPTEAGRRVSLGRVQARRRAAKEEKAERAARVREWVEERRKRGDNDEGE